MISIVLPVYNGEKHIAQAIYSIINQSYENWELIIIDDCSIDNTASICKSFNDRRIKYFRNEFNMKLPTSLNNGFAKASGDYLTWTSDDNILHSNFLETFLVKMNANENIALLYSDMNYVDENGDYVDNIATNKGEPDELVIKNVVGASFMYPAWAKKIIGDYDAEKFLVEDYDYWLRLSKVGKIEKINEVLYTYRFHSQSLTSTRKKEIIKRTNKLLSDYLHLYNGKNKGIAYFALGLRKIKYYHISGLIDLVKGFYLEPQKIVNKISNKVSSK